MPIECYDLNLMCERDNRIYHEINVIATISDPVFVMFSNSFIHCQSYGLNEYVFAHFDIEYTRLLRAYNCMRLY